MTDGMNGPDESDSSSYAADLDPQAMDELMEEVLGSKIPRPVRWAELQPAEYADQLRALAAWVQWLGRRYNLGSKELPSDWWKHGALVEELSALKGAWDVAFDPTQAASAAADWHLTFYNTRVRLRDWTSRIGGNPSERPEQQFQPWLANPDESGWAHDFSQHLQNITRNDGYEPPTT